MFVLVRIKVKPIKNPTPHIPPSYGDNADDLARTISSPLMASSLASGPASAVWLVLVNITSLWWGRSDQG